MPLIGKSNYRILKETFYGSKNEITTTIWNNIYELHKETADKQKPPDFEK